MSKFMPDLRIRYATRGEKGEMSLFGVEKLMVMMMMVMIVKVQCLLELLICTYSHCCVNDDGNDSNGTISTGVIVHILPLLCK